MILKNSDDLASLYLSSCTCILFLLGASISFDCFISIVTFMVSKWIGMGGREGGGRGEGRSINTLDVNTH